MIRSNGSLPQAALILRARFLVQQEEEWLYEITLLSEIKDELTERVRLARARKENYSYKRELEAVNTQMALINRFLKMTKIDVYLCVSSLVDRGLCDRGDVHEYLGVWRHDD